MTRKAMSAGHVIIAKISSPVTFWYLKPTESSRAAWAMWSWGPISFPRNWTLLVSESIGRGLCFVMVIPNFFLCKIFFKYVWQCIFISCSDWTISIPLWRLIRSDSRLDKPFRWVSISVQYLVAVALSSQAIAKSSTYSSRYIVWVVVYLM